MNEETALLLLRRIITTAGHTIHFSDEGAKLILTGRVTLFPEEVEAVVAIYREEG